MDDNEVVVSRALRIYRNELVAHIRAGLQREFGAEGERELERLFSKRDIATGQTRWETMRANAIRARAAPEVALEIPDGYELLGVMDLFPIFEKFFAILAPHLAGDGVPDEARKGVLRCMQQVRVFRDPNAHPVTLPVGNKSSLLCLLNCYQVLNTLRLESAAKQIDALLHQQQQRAISWNVGVIAIGASPELLEQVSQVLRQRDVSVESFVPSDAASIERWCSGLLTPNVTVLIGEYFGADAGSSDVKELARSAIAAASKKESNLLFAIARNIDQCTFAAELGGADAAAFTNSRPITYLSDYKIHFAELLRDRLRPTPAKEAAHRAPVTVAAAFAVHDEALAPKLFSNLMDTELRDVKILSPFMTDPLVHTTKLSELMIRAKQRGVDVSLVTRPPLQDDIDYKEKLRTLELLDREKIDIFLNERLHAKVYLFTKTGDRYTWIVGSHNATTFALTDSLETSMLGVRKLEFQEAATSFQRLRRHPRTQRYSLWQGKFRKLANSPLAPRT